MLGEAVGAVDAGTDVAEVVLLLGFVLAHGQDFGLDFEGSQRAAQFVGGIGSETLFALEGGGDA